MVGVQGAAWVDRPATLGAMKLLTPRQFAKATNQHHTTVYRQIAKGEIPTVKETKEFIRIPWDEKKNKICQATVVARSKRRATVGA